MRVGEYICLTIRGKLYFWQSEFSIIDATNDRNENY